MNGKAWEIVTEEERRRRREEEEAYDRWLDRNRVLPPLGVCEAASCYSPRQRYSPFCVRHTRYGR